jgi:iron-sulfur cluster assembly accessory protein
MVELTEFAAERVKALAAADPEAKVLRLAVEGGGCSGFQYAIGFDTGSEDGDLEIDSHGVRVVIDPISLPYLQGSLVDFKDRLMGAGFSFEPERPVDLRLQLVVPGQGRDRGSYSPKPDGCWLTARGPSDVRRRRFADAAGPGRPLQQPHHRSTGSSARSGGGAARRARPGPVRRSSRRSASIRRTGWRAAGSSTPSCPRRGG